MKEKIITLKVDGAAQGQWSSLLLELNIMKKAWKPYGVNMDLQAPKFKSIVKWGTSVKDYTRPTRQTRKSV